VLLTGAFCVSALAVRRSNLPQKRKRLTSPPARRITAEPDKILYDKAIEDVRRGRHEVGRLNLQTLINTYPDSEYLAKAETCDRRFVLQRGRQGEHDAGDPSLQGFWDFSFRS